MLTVLYLGVGPCRVWPLPCYRVCWCHHCSGLVYAGETVYLGADPAPLALTVFLPPLLWCYLSLRGWSCGVDSFIVIGLPTICWSLHCIHCDVILSAHRTANKHGGTLVIVVQPDGGGQSLRAHARQSSLLDIFQTRVRHYLKSKMKLKE